jgi:hypothetical protein
MSPVHILSLPCHVAIADLFLQNQLLSPPYISQLRLDIANL